jgi:hypothetical protein
MHITHIIYRESSGRSDVRVQRNQSRRESQCHINQYKVTNHNDAVTILARFGDSVKSPFVESMRFFAPPSFAPSGLLFIGTLSGGWSSPAATPAPPATGPSPLRGSRRWGRFPGAGRRLRRLPRPRLRDLRPFGAQGDGDDFRGLIFTCGGSSGGSPRTCTAVGFSPRRGEGLVDGGAGFQRVVCVGGPAPGMRIYSLRSPEDTM